MVSSIDYSDMYLLLLIRRFEQMLLDLFARGLIDGTTHTCIGQEYVPVAVSGLLRDGDYVFSNHRGHGHYLSRFRDPVPLLAEITGRVGGVCNGVGGSQHLRQDGYFSSGVQGQSLPVAVGVAVHLKRAARGEVALAYIGDGTFGEGAVYEALNMARLWEAPVVVVVENNHIAQTTATHQHLAGSIRGRAEAFGAAYVAVDGCDVSALRAVLQPEFTKVREGGGPLVVEFDTVRLGPHSKGDDTRDAAEVAVLQARDWHAAYERCFPEQFAEADEAARAAVGAATSEVLARAMAEWSA